MHQAEQGAFSADDPQNSSGHLGLMDTCGALPAAAELAVHSRPQTMFWAIQHASADLRE